MSITYTRRGASVVSSYKENGRSKVCLQCGYVSAPQREPIPEILSGNLLSLGRHGCPLNHTRAHFTQIRTLGYFPRFLFICLAFADVAQAHGRLVEILVAAFCNDHSVSQIVKASARPRGPIPAGPPGLSGRLACRGCRRAPRPLRDSIDPSSPQPSRFAGRLRSPGSGARRF